MFTNMICIGPILKPETLFPFLDSHFLFKLIVLIIVTFSFIFRCISSFISLILFGIIFIIAMLNPKVSEYIYEKRKKNVLILHRPFHFCYLQEQEDKFFGTILNKIF